ncbi:MAG: cyclic nucleotide-binding domain-containing protein [Chloroflexota bacterium]
MSEKISSRLKQLPLFERLPDEVINKLAESVVTRNLSKNEVLFQKGEKGNALYIIRTGWVKIVTEDEGGKELVLNHCGPGEVIGEIELIDESPRMSGAVAISSGVELVELKRDVFLGVLQKQPLLTMDIMQGLCAKLRFAITYIEKAVEWSNRIAEGDYGFAKDQIRVTQSTIIDARKPDEARASELLSAFFRMVEGVQQREETLKQQLLKFSIEIDDQKRREEVEGVIQSTFFGKLKIETGKFRRKDQEDKE